MSSKASKAPKIIIVALFLVVMPVLAVWFSKWGLDTYRTIRSEMVLYKDSIQIPDFNLITHRGKTFDKAETNGKMLLVHFAPSMADANVAPLLSQLPTVQKTFNQEDKRRYYVVTYTLDSAAAIETQIIKNQIDTFNWRILPVGNEQFNSLRTGFRINADSAATSVALVDFKGKICDIYDVSKPASLLRLQTHMAIVVPKKQRKRIEYKADKDIYQ